MSLLLLVVVVGLVAGQRLFELRLSKKNERKLRSRGAIESGAGHYPFMVALHSLWLGSMLVEGLFRVPEFHGFWLFVFLTVQPVRYWAISVLGDRWNTKVLIVPGEQLVRRGPYRYLSHPNYVVVVVEILALPLVFGCWVTALVFTLLNAALLYVRTGEENRALSGSPRR
ncbi:isoprenylcysteine carboxyl methyltransferase family protein [Rubrobacter indicoceani]|uniref:isoprenylcysteine carboxyl methyltransferase family protein n=1 Tax=Rubrobacter indicoceani TaxID=2051957 RepID=UPI000E5BDA68|nr:isoprenylcysteine carboxylmethyltransferase family protein [Rubrobacter indicoceani]